MHVDGVIKIEHHWYTLETNVMFNHRRPDERRLFINIDQIAFIDQLEHLQATD